MTKLLIASLLFFAPIKPNWLSNLDVAKETAKKNHKLILLNFSGSDWCIPCIKLHEEIFNTDAFTSYAEKNLVLVNADFPRRKKNQLSLAQQKINDNLAEKYNPEGAFPITILLDSLGNKIKVWDGFYKKGTENFVQEIKDASAK